MLPGVTYLCPNQYLREMNEYSELAISIAYGLYSVVFGGTGETPVDDSKWEGVSLNLLKECFVFLVVLWFLYGLCLLIQPALLYKSTLGAKILFVCV